MVRLVKNPPTNAGDGRDEGSIPWVRKIPWRRKEQPAPVFLPREFHGQRSLAGYSPWGGKESDTTDRTCTRTDTHHLGICCIPCLLGSIILTAGTSLTSSGQDSGLPMQRVWVQSLAGELRSQTLYGVAKNVLEKSLKKILTTEFLQVCIMASVLLMRK